jgi:hypothetical protein
LKERRSLLAVHWHAILALLLIIAIIVPIVAYLVLPSSKASSSPPTLSMSQVYNTSLQKGQTILVNFTASNVAKMVSSTVNVAFDPTVLQVTTGDPKGYTLYIGLSKVRFDIYEGPFLSSSGGTYFIVDGADNTLGTITGLYDGIIGSKSSSGSGVIASINFTCISATTKTAINITGWDGSIDLNLTGTSRLQNSTVTNIQHQDLNGFVTANSPPPPPAQPSVWTRPWFQATLIAIVIEIIIVALGILLALRGWRTQAETESKERDELDELLR